MGTILILFILTKYIKMTGWYISKQITQLSCVSTNNVKALAKGQVIRCDLMALISTFWEIVKLSPDSYWLFAALQFVPSSRKIRLSLSFTSSFFLSSS